jgi:hypothetical protein
MTHPSTLTLPRPKGVSTKPVASAGLLSGDAMVYLALIGLTWLTWRVSRRGYFGAGDDIGYWLGVAGGVMMLLLFTYPLRKHLRFARNWGRVKWWFWVHMCLGVGGPLLILLHSTFQVRSLNSAVALYSMLIVALSGVVGRFIYARVNRGMHGEQTTLRDLENRAGLHQREARSRLSFAPAVEKHLKEFADGEMSVRPDLFTCLRRVFWLPVKQWIAYRTCTADVHLPLRELALETGWDGDSVARRERLARKLIRRYLKSVVRVAQYTAYERLFSLWHVAHVPFVYLLIISAIVHVIAVHAY